MINERQRDAIDDHHAGRRGIGPEARSHRCRKSGELGDIRRHTRHADAAHHNALLEQRHPPGIDGRRIAIIQVRFAGKNTKPGLRAVDGSRRRKFLPLNVLDIERTAAVGILDAVQRSVAGVIDSRRKVDAADVAHRSRRQRRLIVTEKTRCPGQRHRHVPGISLHSEISGRYRGSRWLLINGEDMALAIGNRDHHGIRIHRRRRCFHHRGDIGRRQHHRIGQRMKMPAEWRARGLRETDRRCRSKYEDGPREEHCSIRSTHSSSSSRRQI